MAVFSVVSKFNRRAASSAKMMATLTLWYTVDRPRVKYRIYLTQTNATTVQGLADNEKLQVTKNHLKNSKIK